MQTRTVEKLTTEEYATSVFSWRGATFHSKEVCDEVVKFLKADGYSVSVKTVKGQNLHPEYVTDYVGVLETGFGNSQYQTYWSKLYEVKAVR